ncbi:hypothetical protein GCM10007984_26710 [Shewanella putrefaciens]|nr:hypothetical protein GCM10007984_26710 [Shewanella putrefaciens]
MTTYSQFKCQDAYVLCIGKIEYLIKRNLPYTNYSASPEGPAIKIITIMPLLRVALCD